MTFRIEPPHPGDDTPAPMTEILSRVDADMAQEAQAMERPKVERADRVFSKYHRAIRGEHVDVYDVLSAFGVTCPATAHAVKKLLAAGKRGAKSTLQDLQEAQASIARAIELERERVAP